MDSPPAIDGGLERKADVRIRSVRAHPGAHGQETIVGDRQCGCLDDGMLPRLAESRRRYSAVLEAIRTERRVDVATSPPATTETSVLSGS